jgi:ABC-type transport system involved in multi-copper enzyme maturation permease subunit
MRFHLSLNPVLVKEMRGRMRGPRAYLFLTGTLALFGVVTYGLYRLLRFVVAMQSGMSTGSVIGQSLFTGLVLLATLVICAIAPSLTAGAISGEHERKTFDLLLATPLSASSVLFGKLIAALSYVALILLAAIPVVSLAYVFGGVAVTDMLQSLVLLLGFAVTYSTIGLFFSALFRRTGLAVGASYLVLALFVLGTVFAYAVVGVMRNNMPPSWILSLNPFSAMASALAAPMTQSGFPIASVFSFVAAVIGGMGFEQSRSLAQPLWQMTLGIYAWLTVVLFLLTTQLVKPVRRFQPRGRTLAVGALLLIGTVAVMPVIYGPLTPEKLIAWVRWLQSSPRDLVVNGQFAGPLEPKWQTSSYVDRGDEAAGTLKVVSDNDRQIVRFQRTGNSPSVTSINQMVDQSTSGNGWIQLRVNLRIRSASPGTCGPQGNACPLMLKLNYDTPDGGRHEWMQGFQTGENYGNPPMCTTCENRAAHIPVKQDEWHTYESPNLLTTWPLQNASFIRSVTVSAAGESYEVEIREVALLVREGHPLDWSSLDNRFATPTPVFLRGGRIIQDGMIAPVQIAPPLPPPVVVPPPPLPPTLAPRPTPVPTPTPAK